MKTKITFLAASMCLITTFAIAQWQQIGYMIVNANDTVNGANMIRGFGGNMYGCTSKGIFQSGDNGSTWTNITYNTPIIQNEPINCVFVALNGDMYAGSTRRLYKSLDNGSTWAWLNTLPDSLDFTDVNEMNGNIVASYKVGFSTGGAYFSSNGGLTWTASTGLTNVPKWRFLADGNTLYLGSTAGVFKSTDDGQSWSVAGTGFSGGGLRDVIKSGNAFFAGDISGGGLYGSYDNANTWGNVDTVAFDPFCQVFSVTAASNLIIAAMDGTPCNPSGTSPIKMSADTGNSWTVFMNNLPGSFYSTVGRNSAGTSFFTKQGNGKKVYRFDLVTGIDQGEAAIAAVSVFPNPANTSVTIQTQTIPGAIDLYEMTGRIIISQQPVSASTTIQTADLAEGVYILRVRNGNSIITQRLLVTH